MGLSFLLKKDKKSKNPQNPKKRKNRVFDDFALFSIGFRLFSVGFRWSDGAGLIEQNGKYHMAISLLFHY